MLAYFMFLHSHDITKIIILSRNIVFCISCYNCMIRRRSICLNKKKVLLNSETFRERVCLTISVQELQEQDWTKALTAELDRGIGNLVFINGNLPHDEIHPYIQTAAKDNAQFTLKTDPEYKTDPDSLAVVVAAKTAVYQSPVDVKKRYPNLVNSNNSTAEKNNDQHQSFFHHLFHRKDRG